MDLIGSRLFCFFDNIWVSEATLCKMFLLCFLSTLYWGCLSNKLICFRRLIIQNALCILCEPIADNRFLLILLFCSHMSSILDLGCRGIKCSIVFVKFIIFIWRFSIETISVCLKIWILLHARVKASQTIFDRLLFIQMSSHNFCLLFLLSVQVLDIIKGSIVISEPSCAC